jgi:NAD(P)-dependent dehydrogenase (short-subunit alcohol dehydrogenase family)
VQRLLDGKTAIVTGAGGGVGEGIARAMAAHGANVVIAARRPDNGEPVAASIRDQGGEATFVQCDVASRSSIEATVAATVERYRRLDSMVHNALAPVGPPTKVHELPPDTWQAMLSTAVRASYDCAQVAYPQLKANRGSYILITSATGVEGSPTLPVYGMVKAAQRGFGKSLAREWGPDGIRVNLIGPVAVTPALEVAYAANPILEERLVARTPMRRVGDPTDDIGPIAVFLASDLAHFMAGQTLMIDGGGFMGL